jgi:hypothetical protein
MGPEDWAACTQVDLMLKRLEPKKHRRKWVLFNCACCRRVWDQMPEDCRAYVEAAERYALGTGLKKNLGPLKGPVNVAVAKVPYLSDHRPWYAAVAASTVTNTTRYCAWNAARAVDEAGRVAHRRERQAQADLLREVIGNRYRPVAVEPAWLTWNSGAVPRMAQALLADGHFSDLPVLADALEEAGCTDEVILSHCRGGGEHVRGCWVVDLLTGRA